MGYRGRSLHVRNLTLARARVALPKLGVSFAWLGCNDRWASLVPLDDDGDLDGRALAKQLRRPVLQIWSDDDAGVGYQLYSASGVGHELMIALDASYAIAIGDRRWIDQAVAADAIPEAAAQELRRRLGAPAREVEAWALAGGLETLVGVPHGEPLPVPCDAATAREHAPGAQRIAVRSGRVAKSRKPAPMLPRAKRRWTRPQRALVELYVEYMLHVWSLNDWKIYNRLKKHLPPTLRHEVDRLVTLRMTDRPEREFRALVEAILDAVWDADDWAAALAHPEIGRWDLEPAQLVAWQQRVATVVGGAKEPTPKRKR